MSILRLHTTTHTSLQSILYLHWHRPLETRAKPATDPSISESASGQFRLRNWWVEFRWRPPVKIENKLCGIILIRTLASLTAQRMEVIYQRSKQICAWNHLIADNTSAVSSHFCFIIKLQDSKGNIYEAREERMQFSEIKLKTNV